MATQTRLTHRTGAHEIATVSRERSVYRGTSFATQRMWQDLDIYAGTPYPVLFCGPTGSGKTLLARELHARSMRKSAAFVSLSIPSVPEELRQAELFGHVRGAYTGAVADRAGALEAANGGTLFLDELGHASLKLQQALLTVIEDDVVQRVGDSRTRPVDVRYVFASAADLRELVEQRRFLEELYFRVGGLTIRVPPLRERPADILPLVERFVDDSLRELQRPYQATFSAALCRALMAAPWPGNLRELRSVARHLALKVRGDQELDVGDLPEGAWVQDDEGRAGAMQRALERAGGNKSRAARELGISRATFYREWSRLAMGDAP